MVEDLDTVDLILRCGAASLFGGFVGWDRERRDKAAGLRTMMLVALGACAAVLTAMILVEDIDQEPKISLDPIRVISGVVGGVGFLGAGSIIQSRGHIKGMTTAATIWVSAGIGMACGFGHLALAAVVTGFALLMLAVVGSLKGTILPEKARDHDDRPDEADEQDHRGRFAPTSGDE